MLKLARKISIMKVLWNIVIGLAVLIYLAMLANIERHHFTERLDHIDELLDRHR
jgi:hypothetical protein